MNKEKWIDTKNRFRETVPSMTEDLIEPMGGGVPAVSVIVIFLILFTIGVVCYPLAIYASMAAMLIFSILLKWSERICKKNSWPSIIFFFISWFGLLGSGMALTAFMGWALHGLS